MLRYNLIKSLEEPEEVKENPDLLDKKARIDDISQVSSHEELILNLLDKLDILSPNVDKNEL